MKINFEDDYSKIILKRGLEYYNYGCIKNVGIKDNSIEAMVEGTNNYHVGLEIKGGKVVFASCDCPYYYDHDECKHIVAVLYYLTNEKIENQKNEESTRTILDKINEKELKDFLENLIENEESIYDLFRRKFVNYFPKISLATYKRKIEFAIREAGGRDGFIDYNEGWNYTRKMYEFTNEALNLVENGDYETAFVIARIILDSIPDTAIDGSNGETSEVANSCIEVIISILNKASKDDKIVADILDYILIELKTHNLNSYGIELDDLIINFIRDGLFLQKCEIALINAIKDCDDSKWYSYSKKYYLDYLEELYDKQGDNLKKRNLIKNNLDIIEIFEKYIEILMNEKDTKEIIKDLINYRKKYPSHQKYITDKLLEIYYRDNMALEYKNELYQAFFEFDKYNFEKYIKIKQLYDRKEWITEIEKIISKIEKSSHKIDILAKIFIEEKMIDRLYELVKDNNIYYYEDYLIPKYRNELIEKYIEKCKRNLKFASNRSNYRDIAGELTHIKMLDTNKKYITPFLEHIRKEYSNKPALMDEISHVK